MTSHLFSSDFIAPLLIFSIPILAIVGGITAGIVKTLARQRIVENMQRERLAAIERGLDPSKLPSLPGLSDLDPFVHNLGACGAERQAQGLMIGGLVTLATGIGLGFMLYLITDEQHVWSVGLIPGAIGLALLISAWIVKPRGGSGTGTTPPAR